MSIPQDLVHFEPLAIDAASAATLSAFREVMKHASLTSSFSKTAKYEAAGTIRMLGLQAASGAEKHLSFKQLESAMWMWSDASIIYRNS